MKISFATLWKLAALLALAAICALLYLKFLRPTDVSESKAPKSAAAEVDPNFARLSSWIEALGDGLFSPLEGKAPQPPPRDLIALRQEIVNTLRRSPSRGQPAYQTATELCDALLLAMQGREHFAASLAETRAKPHATGTSANPKREAEEKQKFFEASIAQRWSENSKTYRAQISNLRDRLRNDVRRISQASDVTAQAGDTLVLQHATPVRLKYGTTTLPAGLALRVVGRTSNSVTVEYSGEHVVVPLP